MGFKRSTTDIKVHQSLGDTPNVDNGITAEDLKKRYDFPAETIQNDLNALMGELEETTGASNIGAEPLEDGDTSGNTIKDKLIELKNRIANAVLGQIPNGTITKEKLNTDFSNLIAEKDGELQENLNAEMLGGQRLEQFTKVVVGTYVGDGDKEKVTFECGFRPKCVIITHYSSLFTLVNERIIFHEGYGATNSSVDYKDVTITESGFEVTNISGTNFESLNGTNIHHYVALG